MKAILKFDLNEPEAWQEFNHAVKSSNYANAIWEISQYLRSLVRYDERINIPADEIQEHIHQIFHNNNFTADELVL